MTATTTSVGTQSPANRGLRRHKILHRLDGFQLGGGSGTLDVVNLNHDGVGHVGLLVAVAVDVHGAARVGCCGERRNRESRVRGCVVEVTRSREAVPGCQH